jgi:hypothetical protein
MLGQKGGAHNFPEDIQHKLKGGLDIQNENNGELTLGKKQGVSWRLHRIRMTKPAMNPSLLRQWGMPLGQQK